MRHLDNSAVNKLWRGVEARKAEAQRRRTLKDITRTGEAIDVDSQLLVPIVDAEAVWWFQQSLDRQGTRRRKRGEERPVLPPLPPTECPPKVGTWFVWAYR